MVRSEADETVQGWLPEISLAQLVLLKMSRLLLTGTILLGVFIALVALSQAGLTPLRTIVESQGGIQFLFTAFIGTIVTGTAIVVTINQLVLAQELGAFGDQHERMEKSMDFRREIEAKIGLGASPTDPAAFLATLAASMQQRATELGAAVGDHHDEKLEETVREYVDTLDRDAQLLQENLDGAEFGSFDVIWSALKFNYSRKIHTGRKIRSESAEKLSDEANSALEETITLLTFFGPVREHFKTLYFQWELINLSRAMLYISVPALTVMGVLIMYVDSGAVPGALLGVDNLVWLTSAGFAVGISPFIVFIAYVLRIATVAKQTLAIGPFILQEDDRESAPGE